MFSRASVAPISRRSPLLEVPRAEQLPVQPRGEPDEPRFPARPIERERDLGPSVERRDNALHRQFRRYESQVQQERSLEARAAHGIRPSTAAAPR